MSVQLSGTYLYIPSGIVSTYPMTISFWYNPAFTGSVSLFSLCANDGDSVRITIASNRTASLAAQAGGGATQTATTTTTYPGANTWFNLVSTLESNADRSIYMNGGGVGNSTNSVTLTSMNRTSIGVTMTGAGVFNTPLASGNLAELAVWNIVLDTAEIRSLASGFSPQLVRPGNLRFYAPFAGTMNDIRRTFPLTGTASGFVSHNRTYGW